MEMRITNINENLSRRFKALCQLEGKTLGQYLTELMEQELERKLATVKTKLVCEQPFIATIVLRRALEMPPEEWWAGMPKTMCTDGNRIYCHPEFVEKMSKAELVGVLAHEAYHIAGLHPWRKGSRQHVLLLTKRTGSLPRPWTL